MSDVSWSHAANVFLEISGSSSYASTRAFLFRIFLRADRASRLGWELSPFGCRSYHIDRYPMNSDNFLIKFIAIWEGFFCWNGKDSIAYQNNIVLIDFGLRQLLLKYRVQCTRKVGWKIICEKTQK